MDNRFRLLLECIVDERHSKYSRSIAMARQLYEDMIGQPEALERLVALSVVIDCGPKRVIRKGTAKQSGVKLDASLMCLLDTRQVRFSGVAIRASMCSCNEATRGGVERLEITTASSGVEHAVIGNRDHWAVKNMKYEPGGGVRSSRRSTCHKMLIAFEFAAQYELQAIAGAGGYRSMRTELFSDSVVVLSHSNQEIDCLGTLFWDDFYRTSDRDCGDDTDRFRFRCNDNTTVDELVHHLAVHFERETRRPLTKRNRLYLGLKAHNLYSDLPHITFAEFMKRPMTRTRLSFGQWLMSIIKMLKIPSLEALWQNDFIEGFTSKDIDQLLPFCGSFMLRFSERQPAIGVVTKGDNGTVQAWDPYLESYLRSNNLANLLDEFSVLTSIVTTNGVVLGRREALERFMDDVAIDEGYTRRGGDADDRCSGVCSSTDDTSLLEMDVFANIGNHSVPESIGELDENFECDLDDIYNKCNTILKDL